MVRLRMVAAGALLFLAAGCGGEATSSRVEVGGAVTLDGAPLEGAEVKFFSKDMTGFGRTGAGGKYQLVQGVNPGSYKVVVSKMDRKPAPDDKPPEGLDPGQMEAIQAARESDPSFRGKKVAPPKELISADFSDFDQTKLSFDVPSSGTKEANFNLTSN